MNKTKNHTVRTIVVLILLVLVLVVLFNPGLLPFLSEDAQATLRQSIHATFGTTDNIAVLNWPTLCSIAAVVALLYLINRVVCFVLRKVAAEHGRRRTVAGLLISIVNYGTAIWGFAWVLSLLGVNVAGIVASLGILSLVVGFGAQSLIEDIITGIFIIFEGQYNVGDIIILDDFRGRVTNIGVRTTSITDVGGNVKIVNNSDVRNLQNRSQNLSLAVCDVGISYDARLTEVEALLKQELPNLTKQAGGLFVKDIEYLGVQELGSSAVVLRFTGTVQEENVFLAQRWLNRAIKLLFDAHSIEIPYTQITLHTAQPS